MARQPWLSCADCDLPYSDDGFADFVVDDDVWRKITADDGANILCANCITRRAVRVGLTDETGHFTSGPFAVHHLPDEVTMTDEKDPYNDGYTHEALHSAHICVSMWDEFVTNTRCADQYPDIKEAAAKAGRAMADVYQMLGMKFADEPPNDKCVDCGSEGNCKPGCPSRL